MEKTAVETVLKKIEDVEIGDEVVKNYGSYTYYFEKVACKKQEKAVLDKREPEDCIILGNGFDTLMQLPLGTLVMVVKR